MLIDDNRRAFVFLKRFGKSGRKMAQKKGVLADSIETPECPQAVLMRGDFSYE